MPDFSDFFCPEEEIHNLKIELEELKNKFDELEVEATLQP
jgi:hypothetical protein